MKTTALSWQIRWGSVLLAIMLGACGTLPQGPNPQDRKGQSSTSQTLVPGADGPPQGQVDIAGIPNAKPRVEPRSKRGNPATYSVLDRTYKVRDNSEGYVEKGVASWYGAKFQGRPTSSGEPYDPFAMTAAHKTLPIPTYVRVTHLDNGRQVIVRINDRGPFHDNRIIDLSYAAAKKLGIADQGTGQVKVRALDPRRWSPSEERLADQETSVDAPQPGLYLQVGAFSQRDNAEQLRQRLHQTATGSVRVTETKGTDPLYRVRIGPLDDAQAADQLAETLDQLGLDPPQVVIE